MAVLLCAKETVQYNVILSHFMCAWTSPISKFNNSLSSDKSNMLEFDLGGGWKYLLVFATCNRCDHHSRSSWGHLMMEKHHHLVQWWSSSKWMWSFDDHCPSPLRRLFITKKWNKPADESEREVLFIPYFFFIIAKFQILTGRNVLLMSRRKAVKKNI